MSVHHVALVLTADASFSQTCIITIRHKSGRKSVNCVHAVCITKSSTSCSTTRLTSQQFHPSSSLAPRNATPHRVPLSKRVAHRKRLSHAIAAHYLPVTSQTTHNAHKSAATISSECSIFLCRVSGKFPLNRKR